ncbi:MAG: hypothetical protein ACFBRM_05275 [Pikeienuella sp.]
MKRFGSGAAIAAAAPLGLVFGLGGCDSFRLFNDYEVVESPSVAEAPWPRLVEVPETPPPGTFTADIPDPVVGIAVETELSVGAAGAGTRVARVAPPVLTEPERATLLAREARARDEAEAQSAALSEADRRALADAAAKQPRIQGAPLTEDERAALEAAAARQRARRAAQ